MNDWTRNYDSSQQSAVFRLINTNFPVGTISGSHSISVDGSFIYQIPIDLPPGTAGIKPSLSIFYNSSSGDGLLGKGWDIEGLSAISRISQNTYNDSYVKGITLSLNDRFSLDGNRLILTGGPYYGYNGTKYHTESENFTETTAHGTTGYGPNYFTVITKEGLTLEYGNSTDSKIEPFGSSIPYMWRLNKTKDSLGNYISYSYSKFNGNSVISQISYTGFTGGHSPYNNIYFQYQAKTNKDTWYINGKSIKDTVILKKIIIISETDTVKQYEFKYLDIAGESRLYEIIEYGKNSKKFNSTWINWYMGPKAEYSNSETILPKSFHYLPGDYDGDGCLDIIDVSTGKTYSMNNSGTDFYLKWETTSIRGVKDEYKTGDFNGDGKIDLVRALSNSSYSFSYFPSTGTSFSNPVSYGTATGQKKAEIHPGDFNGDGITDLLVYVPQSGLIKVYWGDKTNPFSSSCQLSISWANDQHCYDFNGNGKAEIMIRSPSGCTIYEWDTNSFSQIYSNSLYKSNSLLAFGDYNGDGMMDFIQMCQLIGGRYKVYSCISNGNGFFRTAVGDTISYPQKCYIFDKDGDGRDEFIVGQIIPEDAYIFSFKNGSFSKGTTELYGYPSLYGDFDGDGLPECLYVGQYNKMWIANFIGKNNGFNVYSIIDGLGNTIKVSYKPLSDSSIHKMQTNGSYPVIDFGSTQYVVSGIQYDNGLGGQNKVSFFYEGAKFDIQRGRFLGFSTFIEADSTAQIKKRSKFLIDDTYYFPIPDSSRSLTLNNSLISGRKYTGSKITYGNKRYFSYISQVVDTSYIEGLKTTSNYSYNSDGNLTNVTTYTGSDTSVSNYTYIKLKSWCPNKPATVNTSLRRTGQSNFNITNRYQYYANGLLKYKVEQESDTNKVFTLYKQYDRFGNPKKTAISPDSVNGRNTYYKYDTKGRMVTGIKNDLGDSTELTNNYGLGVVTQSKDRNGLNTNYTYDDFGRNIRVDYPDGTWTSTSSAWAIDGNQVFYLKKQSGGSADTIKYYDKLGREIFTKTVNVKGDSVFVNTVYNTKGQLSYVTLPYFKGESNSAKKTITYDEYGRVTAERAPGTCMKYIFNGKTVTILDSIKNITITREMDNSGTLVKSTDVGDITYSYYANKLVKEINCLNLSTTMEYDAFGRQSKLIDPNAGTTKYGYNPYGQLIKQIDALNQTTSLAYDTLGRIKTRNEMTFNTNWRYNSNTTLTRVQGSHGVTQKYTYDSYGRPKSVTDSINSLQLTTNFDYDSNGRISKITYPSGFSITYHYQNGYLKEIKRGDNSASIWKIETLNARGQITKETFGNGVISERTYNANAYLTLIKTGTNGNVQNLEYIYNSKGQLYQRKDHRHSSITETFEYDNMDRITSSVINGNMVSVAYANNGNINTKSDLGVYTYNQQHPHAVESVTCYDTSNHYTMQDISYTSFKMASQLTQGDSTLVFTYGPDYARKKSLTTIEGVATTRYYSGSYEKIVTSSSTKELHYITAYGRIVAIARKSGGTTTMYYVHTDNLGSVNCITNSSSSIVQETSFTAWGRRRDPSSWQVLSTTPANLITSRGYTGHEHIDEFNLINMNGRIFDPILCRFLSPDPFIANAGFSQDYNRYSYCLNNPLRYIDPTGYKFFDMLCAIHAYNGGSFVYRGDTWIYDEFIGYGGGGFYNARTGEGAFPMTYKKSTIYICYGSGVGLKTMVTDWFISNKYEIRYQIDNTYKHPRDYSGGGGHLLPPVDTKYPITSPYNEGNRVIPELGINRPHLAIDIGTPVGTPIKSPWSGKVVMAQDTEYGLSVIVKHDYQYNGQYIQTGYAHLSEMNVTNGLIINRGDLIGLTGTWGTGPHLHFTLRIGDQKVNPTILFPYK